MLGYAPIQKPDAYIHFAPKEPMELKYCVSISADKELRLAEPLMLSNAPIHYAVGIAVPLLLDENDKSIFVGTESLFAGAGLAGRSYPNIFTIKRMQILPRPNLITSLLSLSQGYREINEIAPLVAPFGFTAIQLPYRVATVITGNSPRRLSWTYLGPRSIRSVNTYELQAEGETPEPGKRRVRFRATYWLRIRDSFVERLELTIPPTSAGLGGVKFVMTRIR